MKERRLLERISNWSDGDAQRTNQTQVEILVRSVSEHLKRLLNTRQGSVQIDPNFGVPDFTNLADGTGKGSVKDMEEEIRRMVMRYEPRLKSPRVALNSEATDVLSIRFSLYGTLQVEDRDIPLQISTTVGSNGRIDISY